MIRGTTTSVTIKVKYEDIFKKLDEMLNSDLVSAAIANAAYEKFQKLQMRDKYSLMIDSKLNYGDGAVFKLEGILYFGKLKEFHYYSYLKHPIRAVRLTGKKIIKPIGKRFNCDFRWAALNAMEPVKLPKEQHQELIKRTRELKDY